MENQRNKNVNANQSLKEKISLQGNKGYGERKRLEMKRRIGILKERRIDLENELKLIQNSLQSFNQQIKNSSAYEQLSIK